MGREFGLCHRGERLPPLVGRRCVADAALSFSRLSAAGLPLVRLEDYRKKLVVLAVPVEELAKSESLSQGSEAYEKYVAEGGKPRRASAEAALQLMPRPRMGERVKYYISSRPTRGSDWQRACPLELYDPEKAPYDADYYTEKLNDWIERYGPFLGLPPPATDPHGVQGELF